MKRRILRSHRWILSGCFLFALFLMTSVGFSRGAPADEGYADGGKKSSPQLQRRPQKATTGWTKRQETIP